MRHSLAAGASLFALLLVACGDAAPVADDRTVAEVPAAEVPEPVVQTAQLGTFGVSLDNMDTNVDPGENFFEYVNGTWLETTEIPADRSRYGAFNVLSDRAEKRVRGIIEDAASSDNPSADEKRIADLYNAFMDTDAIEAAGLDPIRADLDRIRSAETREDIIDLMSDAELGLSAPVSPYIYIDAKQNDEHRVYLTQSGLGLPNRDAYFEEGERADTIRAAYVDYIETMLTEAGADNPRERAEAVMAFETALAEGHWTPVQRRDRDAVYNKMTKSELSDMAGGMPWDRFFANLGLDGETELIVRENTAVENAARVFADTDVDVLSDYLTVSLLSNNAAYLPKRIDDAQFDFYGRTLNGQEEQRPRWKRAVSQINNRLGFVVGKVYVDRYFPQESKDQMDDLVENLRAAFKDGLDNLEWMGDETKEQAQYKLAKFNPKIGYPDVWETYEGLQIDRDDLYGTVKSARAWGWNDQLSDLGAPIDRDEWGMTPQRVNAYYNSILNEIVFPAAILDAPFFDPNADPAVNYGGIGAVIGHEMGHGFDDQGRKSDGDGVQRDWWTVEDAERYEERAAKLSAQYSEFEPLPGEFLNGDLGLGENIGDLTGVTMAYDAYKRSLNGEEAPVIDGFTGDQRFFMAWAQVWAIKWREEALSQQIKNGPHSPGEFRANGIVRNIDAWYEAFDVGPDDAMYLPPEERVKIW
ncbi:M13 family metallopeptidase [uncultured Algimonas sp.]|uniref:M13 family metallopeptidase n=1 Tax=uncultured Algimonas sp. TaxID=1547920 RepID=UPI0026316975|nr:M13 family metallopeptidase [uncultured Algimonas sp.]